MKTDTHIHTTAQVILVTAGNMVPHGRRFGLSGIGSRAAAVLLVLCGTAGASGIGIPTAGSMLGEAFVGNIMDKAIEGQLAVVNVKMLTTHQGMELADRALADARNRIESYYDERIRRLRSVMASTTTSYSPRDYHRHEEQKRRRLADLQDQIDRMEDQKGRQMERAESQKRRFIAAYEPYWRENDKRIVFY
jgi:hypothetical protein